KVRKKVLRKAINEASKIVLKAAKANVPRASGLLKKSLGRKVKVYRASGTVVAIIGPRTGFKQDVHRDGRKVAVLANPTKYAHLVERGTRHSPARPFMRPAFESTKPEVQSAMSSIIKAGLDEAAAGRG